MKAYRIQIRGQWWRIRLLSNRQFSRIHCPGTLGITDTDKRTIDFIKEGVSNRVVTHEICHAYFSTLHISSTAKLTLDDYEEMCCDVLGDYLDVIFCQVGEVLAYLKDQAGID